MNFLKKLFGSRSDSPSAQPISAEYEQELYDDWVYVREQVASGLKAKGVEMTDEVARQIVRRSLDIVVERRNLPPGLLAGIVNRRFGKNEGSHKPASASPPFRAVFTGANLDGLWVRDEADTKNHIAIATWCTMKGASSEIVQRATVGDYRVLPSTKHGGWFCMFGPPSLDPEDI